MAKQNIKKGDTVKVITGNAKGKTAKVLEVYPKESKILVEGVNVVKRHLKPTSTAPNGSIVEKELPIHVSNVMLVENGQAVRIRRTVDKSGNRIRISAKTGNAI